MKIYSTLSEAIKAIHVRASRQVIGIVSINGNGYFVKRSTVSATEALKTRVVNKLALTDDLKNFFGEAKGEYSEERFAKLKKIMGTHMKMPATELLHAEENIILSFNDMVKLYHEKNPNKKIKTIEIFLSHAPCTGHKAAGGRQHSQPKQLDGVEMPAGCFDKLDLFFKKQYRATQAKFFVDMPKIRIKYCEVFAAESKYEGTTQVAKVDPELRAVLKPVM